MIISIWGAPTLCADNLTVAKLSLSWDCLTMAPVGRLSIWMTCSVEEVNPTFGTAGTPAGASTTVDSMRMLVSSAQVKIKIKNKKNCTVLFTINARNIRVELGNQARAEKWRWGGFFCWSLSDWGAKGCLAQNNEIGQQALSIKIVKSRWFRITLVNIWSQPNPKIRKAKSKEKIEANPVVNQACVSGNKNDSYHKSII